MIIFLDKTLTAAAGCLSGSFRAEAVALLEAMKEIQKSHKKRIVIFTDSKALLQKLKSGTSHLELGVLKECIRLLKKLEQQKSQIITQWIPSHIGLEGNEMADRMANEARTLDQTSGPIEYKTVKAINIRKITNRLKELSKPSMWEIDKRLEKT